jgi:hypothetical protein
MNLPKGAPEIEPELYGEALRKKGFVGLTNEDGCWDLAGAEHYGSGRRFDPSDLVIDETKLAVRRGDGYSVDEVYTTDREAVEKAEALFDYRWDTRRQELAAEFIARFSQGAAGEIQIGGVGLRHLVAAIANADRHLDELIETAEIFGVPLTAELRALPTSGFLPHAKRVAIALAWSETLSDEDAGHLLDRFAQYAALKLADKKLKPPAERLKAEQARELSELLKKPVPWLQHAKGAAPCPRCGSWSHDDPEECADAMFAGDEEADAADGQASEAARDGDVEDEVEREDDDDAMAAGSGGEDE